MGAMNHITDTQSNLPSALMNRSGFFRGTSAGTTAFWLEVFNALQSTVS